MRLPTAVRRPIGCYGGSPLHLLALLCCFAVAGYAAIRLAAGRPIAVAVWFIGAAVAHDVIVFPLYAIADRSLSAAVRHRGRRLPPGPWINYLRVPAMLSALLLIVWFPLILRQPPGYTAATGFTTRPYLGRWLLLSGVFFAASALALAVHLRRAAISRPTVRPTPHPDQPDAS